MEIELNEMSDLRDSIHSEIMEFEGLENLEPEISQMYQEALRMFSSDEDC